LREERFGKEVHLQLWTTDMHRSGGYSLKTRLYTIIGFLGAIPVLGAVFALIMVSGSTRDNAALDRAGARAQFLSRLMPTCAGSLYIYAHSRDILESAKSWNGGKVSPTMHPEDCWGLRRGRVYTGMMPATWSCARSASAWNRHSGTRTCRAGSAGRNSW
jgi:hypothetical protein